jgi:uncharacterized metal-binding protein YceD (DUF177 family)
MFTIDLLRLSEGINPLKLSFSGDIPFFRGLDVESVGDGVVEGTVDKRDERLYLLNLTVTVPVIHPCRRCLAEFREEVTADFSLIAMRGDKPGGETDSEDDVLYLTENQEGLDLEEPIREYLLLNFPTYPLCEEDCRGICPECGTDLNKDSCSCEG